MARTQIEVDVLFCTDTLPIIIIIIIIIIISTTENKVTVVNRLAWDQAPQWGKS